MNMQNLKKTLVKPTINGAVSAIAMEMITDKDQKYFNYGGKNYSVMTLGFVLGAVSSLGVEAVSNYVLPHIPGHEKFKHLESLVLHLAGGAGTFVGIAKILNSDLSMAEARKFALVGAVSEAVSSFAYENLVQDSIISF